MDILISLRDTDFTVLIASLSLLRPDRLYSLRIQEIKHLEEIRSELHILIIQETVTPQLVPLFVHSDQSTPFVHITPPVQSTSAAPPVVVAPEHASEPQAEQVAPNAEVENPVEVPQAAPQPEPQPIQPLRRS